MYVPLGPKLASFSDTINEAHWVFVIDGNSEICFP